MKVRPVWHQVVWHHGRPGTVRDWFPGSNNVTVRYDDGREPIHAWSVPWRELEAPPATTPEQANLFPLHPRPIAAHRRFWCVAKPPHPGPNAPWPVNPILKL
jgi:hypothetical protein